MTGAVVVRDEVHPRLQDDAALTVRPHGILDRRDDFGVRDAERVYVRPGQEAKPQFGEDAPAVADSVFT